MKKLLSIFTISVFFIGIYMLVRIFFQEDQEVRPKAQNGEIDIIMQDLAEGEISLAGEWHFYKNHLYTPQEIASAPNNQLMNIQVRSKWSNLLDAQNGYGKGTYRLLINIKDNPDDTIFGMKITSIQMSHKMYLNGKLLAQMGNPADKENFIAENKPYTVYFPLREGENELVIQVANYIYAPIGGGINYPIYFGLADDISYLKDQKISKDWLLVAIFIFMSLYFLGVFFQWRRNKYLLYFSGICLGIGLYQFTHGEKVIYFLFSNLSFTNMIRIQYISYTFAITTLFSYLLDAHKKYASAKIIRPLVACCIVLLVYDLAFIEKIPIFLLNLHSILGVIAIFYAAYIFQLAFFHKDKEGLFLLIAIYCLSLNVLARYVNLYTVNYLDNWLFLAPFGTLLMFSLILSMRVATSFKQNEALSFELIKMDQVKDDFFERATHEFLTPINGLQHISDSMLKSTHQDVNSEWKKNIELIHSLSVRLGALVHDVSDFVNLKQGLIKVEKKAVDAYSLMEIERAIFEIMAQKKNIQLINKVSKDLPFITVDENRFRQIVSIILDNALKYTYSGEIIMKSKVEENSVIFSIEDTGIGMSQEQLHEVQLMLQNKERNFILGLGLRIAKQLILLQDGWIEIESEEGKGTVVSFSLPISSEKKRRKFEKFLLENQHLTSPFSMEIPYHTKGNYEYTVLIVDDHMPSLQVMIDIVESLPAKVIAVNDGNEALKTVKLFPKIDLVITDFVMPNVSGYELTKYLRDTYSLVDLPILMVIESAFQADRMNILRMGANDSITKPFHAAEFEARVRNLLMMKEAVNQSIKMEVAFLQSQIKPHFLFNVLNTIIALSYTDIDKSREVTETFAEYLRSSFDFHNTNTLIPFTKELHLVHSYVEIEKARFQNRINIVYDISDVGEFMVPPLIIQPIIENAIHHGIGKKVEGGEILFRLKKQDGKIIITIRDNGVGMLPEKIEEIKKHKKTEGHVGLTNINQRLKYFYGTELEVHSEKNSGTSVVLTLPEETSII